MGTMYPYNTNKYINSKLKSKNKLINGYIVFCDINHPLANCSGYVYLHRHYASIKINHWLIKNEQVHHIDGNKLNNDLNNLQICSCGEHTKIHNLKNISYNKICKYCHNEFITKDIEQIYCSHNCSHASRRKININIDLLSKLVWILPLSKIAMLYCVSYNAIKKYCNRHDIALP